MTTGTNPAPQADPPSPPAPSRPAAKRRWLPWSLVTYLLGVLAVLVALLVLLGWLLANETGTAWLLARVPYVQITGSRGALFGDFDARSVTVPLPGEGAELRLHDLSWRSPHLHAQGRQQWFRISVAELSARRVELRISGEPSTDIVPPTSLAFPVGLDVANLRIDEFVIDGIDTPLRALRGRLALGADDGKYHQLDEVQARWDRLSAHGNARVATLGPLEVDASLELSQTLAAGGEWSARARLTGPLAKSQLQAQIRAPGVEQRPPQTLDASAELKPFAVWPLGAMQARASSLDLSALHSAAPATALDLEASARSHALDQPAEFTLRLHNREAGRSNEGRLPLRSMRIEARARPDDPTQLTLSSFEAELGTANGTAGRISGSGRWSPATWRLQARLAALQPAQLDARAPAMQLDGQLQADGSGFDGPTPDSATVQLRGDLDGTLLHSGPQQPVQVRLDALLSPLRVELREMLAQAGAARASLQGHLARTHRRADWSAVGQATLQDFDPRPWWPGRADSPWRQGPHRLNATARFDVALPPQAAAVGALQQLASLRGHAELALQPSQLAGVPLEGSLALQSAAQQLGQVQLQLDAAGNRLSADAQLAGVSRGSDDHWTLKADLPALDRLQPLWRLLQDDPSTDARLGGSLQARATVDGRWPSLRSDGDLTASNLQIGAARAGHVDARWKAGTEADAPLQAVVELKDLAAGKPSAEDVVLELQGNWAAHSLTLKANANALPPAWVERIQTTPSGKLATRTLALLDLQGSAIGAPATGLDGWRGTVRKLELRGDAADAPPWVRSGEVGIDLQRKDGIWQAAVGAGRAELLGAKLSWKRIDWAAAGSAGGTGRLDADADLEPLDVAPLLARAHPGFGWGGSLRIHGHLKVRSAPDFSADVVIERSSGDLSVTDDAGTRWLGLSDLRLGLIANGGVWSFTAGLAGETLGQAAGAVVAHTSPKANWPAADAPIQGVAEIGIANLGVWGPWLPAGWRLGGQLHASLSLGGRFGAPEYVGELTGERLSVRNLLQGVEVRDGEVAIKLLGDKARIEHFTANAGSGQLSLQGEGDFGATPHADLQLRLDTFQLLGRVDRRIVVSGGARLQLARDSVAVDGDVKVDEGLIDFSRSDAPTLSSDVQVVRGVDVDDESLSKAAADAAAATRAHKAQLDLMVRLGDKLRVRGQGLDTVLNGELRLTTTTSGRLHVDGNVRTVRGTYRAYRQRLYIRRGVLTFNGPLENPQLDIEAIRPNLDVRVGVAVTGTVLVPRVRLFSEPDMSDADKLSWLLRGRPTEGQGTADSALLQTAALALLAGDEPSALEQAFNLIGLDDLSVRQSDTASGGAIVSVGKQLSRNWYVGYERGLNATTGNWQIVYRIARRFTVRAQSGESNSIDVIWSWRWQ